MTHSNILGVIRHQFNKKFFINRLYKLDVVWQTKTTPQLIIPASQITLIPVHASHLICLIIYLWNPQNPKSKIQKQVMRNIMPGKKIFTSKLIYGCTLEEFFTQNVTKPYRLLSLLLLYFRQQAPMSF